MRLCRRVVEVEALGLVSKGLGFKGLPLQAHACGHSLLSVEDFRGWAGGCQAELLDYSIGNVLILANANPASSDLHFASETRLFIFVPD